MASIDTIPNGFSVRYRVDGKSVFCYCGHCPEGFTLWQNVAEDFLSSYFRIFGSFFFSSSLTGNNHDASYAKTLSDCCYRFALRGAFNR